MSPPNHTRKPTLSVAFLIRSISAPRRVRRAELSVRCLGPPGALSVYSAYGPIFNSSIRRFT